MKTKISYVISVLAICLLASCAITGNTTDPLLKAGYLKPIEPVSIKEMGAGAIIDPKDMAIVAPPGQYFSDKDVRHGFSTMGPMDVIAIDTLADWAEKDPQNAIRLNKYVVVTEAISNDGWVTYYRTYPIQRLPKYRPLPK